MFVGLVKKSVLKFKHTKIKNSIQKTHSNAA